MNGRKTHKYEGSNILKTSYILGGIAKIIGVIL